MAHTGFMTDAISFATTDVAGTSKELRIGEFSYGSVFIPAAATTVATLTFWVSHDGATYLQPYDGATAETLTVTASRAYRLNTNLFVFKFLKIVANAGTDTIIVHLGY